MVAPDAESGTKPVQLASGVALLPMRTLNARLVPAGVLPVHEAVPQLTCDPPSKTREVMLPERAYGLTRIQSTVTTPPATAALLTTGRMLALTAMGCEAT